MHVPMFARVHTHNWSPCQNPHRLQAQIPGHSATYHSFCLSPIPTWQRAPHFPLGNHPSLLLSTWFSWTWPCHYSRDEHVPPAWPIRWLHTAGISHWLKDGTHLNWHSERLLLDFYWNGQEETLLLPWECWAGGINLTDARSHVYHLVGRVQPQTKPARVRHS